MKRDRGHTLSSSSRTAVIALGMAFTLGVPSTAANLRELVAPSGHKYAVISTIQELRADHKINTLKYVSKAIPNGPDAIASEANDVWDLFKAECDLAGATRASIYAYADAAAEKSSAGFGFEKDSRGNWRCVNNAKVGVDTPAKVLYKEGFKNLVGGKPQEAVALYTKSIAADPNYAQSYVDRAAGYILLGKFSECIADCNTALKLNPDSAKAYCNRGIAHCKQKQWHEAVADFNSTLKLSPRMVLAYENRATALMALARYEYAIRDLSIVIKLKRNPATAFQMRSVALQKMAESDQQMARHLGVAAPKRPSM